MGLYRLRISVLDVGITIVGSVLDCGDVRGFDLGIGSAHELHRDECADGACRDHSDGELVLVIDHELLRVLEMFLHNNSFL